MKKKIYKKKLTSGKKCFNPLQRSIARLLVSLAFCMVMTAPSFSQRYAFRGYSSFKTEFNNSNPAVDYPVCYNNMDMGYAGGDVNLFANASLAFPEYYIEWFEGQMDTNPHTNPLVKWIITYGGPKGQNLYGLKIAREVMVGCPPGPIVADHRILFESDVTAIRKVLKDAKNAGLLVRDDYKIIQMTKKPNVFVTDTRGGNIIKSLDGVCFEIHHFTFNWPLYSGESNPSDVVDGALWTLNNSNIHGKPLEYVFYYGPFKGYDCSDVNAGDPDPFKYYMNGYWAAGLPKKHPNLIYDFNAFKHACGASRPVLPESNPYSVMGCIKWLIETVAAAEDCTSKGTQWNMNTLTEFGNSPSSSIANLRIESGVLKYTVIGADAHINSQDNLNYCANASSNIQIRIKNGTNNGSLKIYFKTATSNWSENNSVGISITANDANFKTYNINMSTNPNWNGTIKQLRLDAPNGSASGTVQIDYIRLGDVAQGNPIVHIRKRNAMDYAIDGSDSSSDGQLIYLYSQNANNVYQQWEEIDRGGGFYSYKKINTDFCIDGSVGGVNDTQLKLWTCSDTNVNQQWKKISTGDGYYRLVKKDVPFAIDGGVNGADFQKVKIWHDNSTNQNQHWQIVSLGTKSASMETNIEPTKADKNEVIVFPNPVDDILNIKISDPEVENAVVSIFDTSGALLSTQQVSGQYSKINVSAYKSGIYLIKVIERGNTHVNRFIKK